MDKTDEPQPEGKHSKTSFDGRVEYQKIINGTLRLVLAHQTSGNYSSCYRELRILLGLVKEYTNPIIKRDIENKLKIVSELIVKSEERVRTQSNKDQFKGWIDSDIQVIIDLILSGAKHIFLPSDTEEEEVFDWDKFKKESDL